MGHFWPFWVFLHLLCVSRRREVYIYFFRLVMEQNSVCLHMFDLFSKLTDSIFEINTEAAVTSVNDSLAMALVELPVLLEPFDEFLGQTARTAWEMAARKTNFIPYMEFLRELFNETKVK